MDIIRDLLIQKFHEIERRILLVINQLDDEELSWRPNDYSNSIGSLIVHMKGNMNERIVSGIQGHAVMRDRDAEFEPMQLSKIELIDLTAGSFRIITDTIAQLTDEQWQHTQLVRGKERTHLDMLFQCATHFSEHMGQIFYIGKLLKGDAYTVTSIPRKKMDAMRVSAVVLDLDGTLLQSSKQISARNARAVSMCHSLGIKVIYATARPPRTVKQFLPIELQQLGSFVYYNGAYIQCAHTGLELHRPIPAAMTSDLLNACIEENPDIELSIEVLDEWMSLKPFDASSHVGVNQPPAIIPLEQMRKYAATKVLISGPFYIDRLKEKYASQLHFVVTDGGGLIQISSLDAAKEQGVAAICKELGISLEEVVVFGDDYNDMGLFECCGWPVAMGNAVPELKQLAKEITGTNDEDGVAAVLERLLKEAAIPR
ncbi:Cof-type HAD-IIB family hydrolase [Paenibacillus sp. NPDC057967]|uniref:Cof-type HAD-IIB family hydrolase n=1 Tax=Paenibacillus sp. NPDC057967 TaxID=3346293 RepID=UPI0036DB75DA